MVLRAGLEPAHPKIIDFESIVVTNYTIGAYFIIMVPTVGLEPTSRSEGFLSENSGFAP